MLPPAASDLVLCVDVGSTWTKAGLVDLGAGRQIATATHPTTSDRDVLDGLDACVDDLTRRGLPAAEAEVLACSSAGGGLRIAVVGNEIAVSAEAGRRAALSSGGQVVAVAGAPFRPGNWARLVDARPDVVLLCGGTDGGNTASVLAAAEVLAAHGCPVPVVLAANRDAVDAVRQRWVQAGVEHVAVDNVVPRIGAFAPEPARAAVRRLFLSHVIGGKGLSRSSRFAELVRGPTPDVVLTAVELIGAGRAGGLAVVDVGGATTDVYSFVPATALVQAAGSARDLVAPHAATRTVEGDLGAHASASSTEAYGRDAGLIDPGERVSDQVLTRTAAAAGLTRHAGRSESTFVAGRRSVRLVGPDLRGVDLLIGSGGVFRIDPAGGRRLLTEARARIAGPGRLLPADARVEVDREYLLAPIGLLAGRHPEVARALASHLTG